MWPTLAALVMVFLSKSAWIGLLVGAACGAVLLAGGSLAGAVVELVTTQFWPIFSSPWKLSAILFTLILGGFVALVERGGGLHGLVRLLLGGGRAPAKRMQLTVIGFGVLVFFDGLANTMLIGRLLRSAADRCGVSRVKLAYLADATGSAVACLAFISTWIAFQLSMIREGFAAVGQEASVYALFFQSLPTNFYCWFALFLAVVCALREFNPGPMGRAERKARQTVRWADEVESGDAVVPSHWLLAIVPILVLTFSIPVLTYWIGSEAVWPITFEKFASAYGAAEGYVPQILVASSILASLVAGLAWLAASRGQGRSPGRVVSVFFGGVRDLLGPVGVLLAAWMLGSAISQLGAAALLGDLLQGRLAVVWLPVAIFGVGAVISFSTGTSWGTMGVLMPLAIPLIFVMTGESGDLERERLIVAGIGAVFSGAVFGDHCSPFSDTTIVASIAAGVEPMEHVRTQLPFAMIAAGVAALAGFVPLGFGLSPWLSLLMGGIILYFLPGIFPKGPSSGNGSGSARGEANLEKFESAASI
jgi:Na+/H+ antiporter NhaC